MGGRFYHKQLPCHCNAPCALTLEGQLWARQSQQCFHSVEGVCSQLDDEHRGNGLGPSRWVNDPRYYKRRVYGAD